MNIPNFITCLDFRYLFFPYTHWVTHLINPFSSISVSNFLPASRDSQSNAKRHWPLLRPHPGCASSPCPINAQSFQESLLRPFFWFFESYSLSHFHTFITTSMLITLAPYSRLSWEHNCLHGSQALTCPDLLPRPALHGNACPWAASWHVAPSTQSQGNSLNSSQPQAVLVMHCLNNFIACLFISQIYLFVSFSLSSTACAILPLFQET